MAQKDIQVRHASIINKLKTGRFTFSEIQASLSRVGEMQGYRLNTSERTFKRDREDILSLYQINIQCDKPTNSYFIESDHSEELSNKLLDVLNLLGAFNTSTGLEKYFDLEQTARSGSEYMSVILNSIMDRVQLNLNYQSYSDMVALERVINPYFIKEFKGRWYLVAKDVLKRDIRTYALDRIKALTITKNKFIYPKNVSASSYFKYSFGIIVDNNTPLEEVLLSFEPHQGKYVKSLPLHKSQKVVKDSDDELIVKLYVHPTFDFEMQLLSYGEYVQVLKPTYLKARIINRLGFALKVYNH